MTTVITYWEKVRKLQDEVQGGNSKILILFLEFLIKNKVNFRGQLVTDICGSAIKLESESWLHKKETEEAWSLLHDFAHDYYNPKMLCQWCGAAKDNPLGLCSRCGRFPTSDRNLSKT